MHKFRKHDKQFEKIQISNKVYANRQIKMLTHTHNHNHNEEMWANKYK